MNIKLVRPKIELKAQALEYREEHFNNNEFIINGSELLDKINSYEEWLERVEKNSQKETVDPNWVLTDTFFAIRKEDNKIIGIIDLRHNLNDFLKDLGNCGYSVRPSERGKGYATEMLKLLLEYAKKCGLKEIHLSVERENIPSVKSIIKNGGKLERSFEFVGKPADVYLMKLN